MLISPSSDSLLSLRRLAAELLASAVQELFPTALLVGGHATEIGFFYDFIFEQPLHDQVLTLLEVRLKALVKENKEIRSISMMRENAYNFFNHRDQSVLAEKAAQAELNIVSLIQIQDFYDLCPEIQETSTDEAGVIKLLEFSQDQRFIFDEKVEVTRIQGTAFVDPMSLKKFLKAFDQLRKKDHRLLGPNLDLFSFSTQTGKLEPFWHPKGEVLKNLIINHWKTICDKWGVQWIKTPLVVKESFLKNKHSLLSFELEDEAYCLSQSRLEHAIQLFKRRIVSFAELPLRFAEMSQEYQDLEEFLVWGLLRSYSYEADQLITFCQEEQVIAELISSLHFIEQIVRIFGFKGQWYLIASGQKNSKKKQGKKAIEWLSQAIASCSFSNVIEGQDQIPLRGTRLELRLVDCLDREWTGPCIEIFHDFDPTGLFYEMEDQQSRTPVILKTSVLGSLDRFIALLIEQFEGNLPLWLAPEQIRILAIGSQNQAYAETVYQSCRQQGFRVNKDIRPGKLAARIHEAEKEKVPYMILVGDKEREKKLVTVRTFQQKNVLPPISLESFCEKIQQQCRMPNEG